MAMFGKKPKTEKPAKVAKEPRSKRFAQIREAYQITKESRPTIGLWLAGSFVLTWLVVGLIIWLLVGHPLYSAFVSLPFAVLAATFLFSRLAESSAYASIEGQPGAGASVLMSIRKGWTVTPAVAVAKNQDMVHRAVSRQGVVLIGEGTNAVRSMLADEHKKMERFLPGTPVIEVLVGDGEGRVKLRKLQKHVRKLPKTISQVQLREIRARLKAVGGMNIPLPKGPLPKGARMPKAR
ncbi:MAG TPA: DUF4191 domain-containing protein [Candidatus Nanopelagicaceae bacterium]|nr:DUF4191 domain-containing protein [Candidatus Nanopelagicaceae bacterium]